MNESLTKAEKQEVIRQDQSLRDQQRRQGASTYFHKAQQTAGEEYGGRFKAAMPTPTVVGSSPVAYPRMPEGSYWASDPLGPEPLIDARDCASVGVDEAVGGPGEDGRWTKPDTVESDSGAKSFSSRQIEQQATREQVDDAVAAERKAALADRLLQIKGFSAELSSSSVFLDDDNKVARGPTRTASSRVGPLTIRRRI